MQGVRKPQQLLRWMRYNTYTLWLFTYSDIKTIIVPQCVFGICSSIFNSALVAGSPDADSVKNGLLRAPLVIAWVWIVLLSCNIDNQRDTGSIEEDKINKPWRPLAAGRLNQTKAFWIMMVAHFLGIAYSAVLGVLTVKLATIVWLWIYHDPRLSDEYWVIRNAINALAYVSFSVGAVSVAAGGNITVTGLQWFAITGAIILSTIQIQDLPDIIGDAARGRKTMPLVTGCQPCRWSIAILVPLWALAASFFWGVISSAAISSCLLAAYVSWRVMTKKTVKQDKKTWFIWNLWVVSLYTMPFGKSLVY